jgi:hypothetical protein
MSFFRDLFAGPGNAHWDLGRFMAAGSLVSLVAAQFHALVEGQELNIQDFGLALAAVLGGAGALIALKDRARSTAEGGTP